MEARIVLARLNNGIIGFQENVDKIYEYLRTMASHEVNPLVLPPESLRQVLRSIKEEMKQNPRLELPYDPDQDIWSDYSIMRLSPVIMEDFLLLILTVLLVDKSLRMDPYKVHNLPALHPKLNIQFTYQLEGKCLAIGKHGLYAALPSENDMSMHDNFWRFVHDESSFISYTKNRMVYLCLIHKGFSQNCKILFGRNKGKAC